CISTARILRDGVHPVTDSEWTITGESVGTRLDKFLAATNRLGSRRRAAAALRHGQIFLNGVEATLAHAAAKLVEGDVVRIWMARPGSAKQQHVSLRDAGALRIVHEDDQLLVLDKPAGLLAVPLERKRSAPSVYGIIARALRSQGRRPFVVHR